MSSTPAATAAAEGRCHGPGGNNHNHHHHHGHGHHVRTQTSAFIQTQVFHRRDLYLDACERDRVDARSCLERERKFTVAWRLLSKNQIWKKGPPGPPVVLFEDSVAEYKHHQNIWPLGRSLTDLTLYGQIYDYFRYMWCHTKPYKTLGLIILMATTKPLQNSAISYVTSSITSDPKGTSLWIFLLPLFVHVIDRFLYWWHQFYIPLNSQRYQLRCILLTRRVEFPDSHPIAIKWTPGRFNGLLRDVDELVNGVWGSSLKIIEELVTIFWTTTLCLIQLAVTFQRGRDELLPDDPLPTKDFVVYALMFLGLGLITMICPFVWFSCFETKYNDCETMSRDGQALYLSAAGHAVMVDPPSDDSDRDHPLLHQSLLPTASVVEEKRGLLTITGKKSFRVFALSTFRSFFLKLAWSTNYTTLMTGVGCLVTLFILRSDFGNAFSITSTMIMLLSLQDFSYISFRLLDLMTLMSKGCLVLTDVAEILNCDVNNKGGSTSSSSSSSTPCHNNAGDKPPRPRFQQEEQVETEKSSAFLSTISERDTSEEQENSSPQELEEPNDDLLYNKQEVPQQPPQVEPTNEDPPNTIPQPPPQPQQITQPFVLPDDFNSNSLVFLTSEKNERHSIPTGKKDQYPDTMEEP